MFSFLKWHTSKWTQLLRHIPSVKTEKKNMNLKISNGKRIAEKRTVFECQSKWTLEMRGSYWWAAHLFTNQLKQFVFTWLKKNQTILYFEWINWPFVWTMSQKMQTSHLHRFIDYGIWNLESVKLWNLHQQNHRYSHRAFDNDYRMLSLFLRCLFFMRIFVVRRKMVEINLNDCFVCVIAWSLSLWMASINIRLQILPHIQPKKSMPIF